MSKKNSHLLPIQKASEGGEAKVGTEVGTVPTFASLSPYLCLALFKDALLFAKKNYKRRNKHPIFSKIRVCLM
ncbi:MAG: hypothetical protein LKI39_01090 [Bacteroides sp.]|jgi:hypothetical protein|nr:hypothetical protein [Bacteroides sp.]